MKHEIFGIDSELSQTKPILNNCDSEAVIDLESIQILLLFLQVIYATDIESRWAIFSFNIG